MVKEKDKKIICPDCGGQKSHRAKYCRSCAYNHKNQSTYKFKKKKCVVCGKLFKPRTGSQINCDYCLTHCINCGRKLNKRSPKAKACIKCMYVRRIYIMECKDCGKKFKATNNFKKYCSKCDKKHSPMFCVECGKPISKYHQRCNSCNRKWLCITGRYKPVGWKRYEYNRIKYRSKWEIKFAKLCEKYGIKFEYEKFERETRTYPDFYIKRLDRYIELHPDCWGEKRISNKTVLLKDIKYARACVIAMSYKIHGDMYIRQKIEEERS